MLKKLCLAAAFCATASFATWDKFPVLENHKGEKAFRGASGMGAGAFPSGACRGCRSASCGKSSQTACGSRLCNGWCERQAYCL